MINKYLEKIASKHVDYSEPESEKRISRVGSGITGGLFGGGAAGAIGYASGKKLGRNKASRIYEKGMDDLKRFRSSRVSLNPESLSEEEQHDAKSVDVFLDNSLKKILTKRYAADHEILEKHYANRFALAGGIGGALALGGLSALRTKSRKHK